VTEAVPVGGGAAVKVPLPSTFGGWHCPDKYTWPFGHPAFARPCYSTGPAVRVMGWMKASPGVIADVTVELRDADTGTVLTPTKSCPGMLFSKTVSERSCGSFDVKPPRGHRYVVAMRWTYTTKKDLPGATVKGAPFSW
jgi:hypothetical protein